MLTVLVTGSTGQQGGAVLQSLRAADRKDLKIRAMTRSPQSAAAKKLRSQGIDIVQADLEDGASLEAALRGCDAAYLVTDFRGSGDVQGEIQQGKNFVDAAVRAAGVGHVVYSSVAGCEDPEVEHFHSKYSIEKYLHESGIHWTVIRPVGFMDVIPPAGLARTFFLGAMKAVFRNSKQKWIACDDIGSAVARALMGREECFEKTYEIAGDVATVDEVSKALERGERSKGWTIWLPKWLVIALSPYHYRQMFIVGFVYTSALCRS
ncbi:hypothetical protein C7974DRAFT_351080 [Boeremia exigua]|uniref:uncharacterized protein n=1 Tax=Boeremia exigua TaxID=749465 RepID=UPI001E8D9CCE|nr:uncharacterized protein C7974DRAFT_351080 [Boeremia exigua]KAH6642468.1 hypothetical protein C7974DRAFT_351080 [Boeremia exigua]